MRLFFLLATLISLSSASAATVTLKTGQTVPLKGGKITVLRVEDHRCPPRAFCIAAGNATASLLVGRGETVRTVRVSLWGEAVTTPLGSVSLRSVTRPQKGERQRLTLDVQ